MQENLHLGVLAYQFDTIKKDQENLDGHEIDAFAVWSPNKNINVIPLVGLYKPKKDINHLGSQVSDNKTNSYAQLILQYVYWFRGDGISLRSSLGYLKWRIILSELEWKK